MAESILLLSTGNFVPIEDTVLGFLAISISPNDQEFFPVKNYSVTPSSLFEVSGKAPCSCHSVQSSDFVQILIPFQAAKYEIRLVVIDCGVVPN